MMKYFINQNSFTASFMVPSAVADECLKIATLNQLKVILYVMRHAADGISPEGTAQELSLPLSEVEDALLYWAQANLIRCEEQPKEVKEKTTAVIKNSRPSREDVARRGLEDEGLKLLLREAQLKFGRNLKTNESQTLLWIYDDLGLDVSVILMLLQYALSEDRCNITFIEKTAASWVDKGIETVAQAEAAITQAAVKKLAWSRVERAFGIEHRRPSEKELETSKIWLDDWQLSDELLRLAYDVCVDAKSKFVFSYTAKILEQWHKNGFKTVQDVKAANETAKKGGDKGRSKPSYAAYDLELFEKMLNSD